MEQSQVSGIRLMGLLGPREPIPSSSRDWSATDAAAFRDLQERLREVWPTITMRTLARVNRTVVIVIDQLRLRNPLLPGPCASCLRGALPIPRPGPAAPAR